MRLTRKTAAAVGAASLPLLSILSVPSTAAASTAAASPSPPGGDRLTVTMDDGEESLTTYVLNCGPDGVAAGTHPDPWGACDRLEGIGGPVRPVASERVCSMIYGGPQTAFVSGTWHSVPVHERYSRANGCEIDRWQSMEPVLPGT
jgi:Subtilisin inhibitor-like